MTSNTPAPHVIGPDHQLPPPPPSPRKHTLAKIVIAVLLLLVVVIVGLVFWHRHEEAEKAAAKPKAPPSVTVTVAKSKSGNIGLYVEAIGTVTPVFTDLITSQVTGMVTRVHFEEGQIVRKASSIDIDSGPYLATLLQSQGALERDENLLAQARMDLDRYRAAWARNAIQKQVLDDQEKLVLQDEGTVKNDQGVVQYNQIQVGFCHITAPIAGRVGLRLVDQGNVVQSNSTTPLVVIAQLSPITIIFTIPEDDIDLVQAHMQDSAKLVVDAFDRTAQKRIDTGSLLTLDNQIDTTTGTVKARALFANKNGKLFPNQFVNVRLLVTTFHNATLIPSSAIQHNGQVAFVYVIENDTAHMQNVTPGVTDGGLTQVSGIKAGDVVANSGFEKLQDKAKISVAKEPTTEPSTQPSTAPSSQPASGTNEESTAAAPTTQGNAP